VEGLVLATREEIVAGGELCLGYPGGNRLACLLGKLAAYRLLRFLLLDACP